MLGEGNITSVVGFYGFMIEGEVGGVNPLTSDNIIKPFGESAQSKSTAIEIEVWQIKMIEKEGNCINQ